MSLPPELTPGLILVHGNRAEALRDLLVAWMRRHPLAPLEDEVVLVQSNGIAQWLRLALAADASDGGCGIAAAMRFDLPSRFLWNAYRAVLGRDAVPQTSPLDKSRLVWRLMRLLPALLADPAYAPLARFLDDDADARKRFQLAARLADLFDQYQVYRADWLAAWAAGEDTLPDASGTNAELPPEQRWQAALWRALRADLIAAGLSATSGRAAVHERFMEVVEVAGETRPPGLPRRIMVFGISSLPRQSLEVLEALSRWSQLLMCVHNPCEHHWADIVQGRELLHGKRGIRQTRRENFPEHLSDDALHQHAHPLLAAWGRQGRDFIALLDSHDDATARTRHTGWLAEIEHKLDFFEPTGGATLLAQLQDDVRALRPLHETRTEWPPLDPARDASIVFHIAHSPQREVEILHDQLLAAFDADPALKPRDIIVMVPDIDAYAPHVRAVFGLHDASDARRIPFCLADQGRRATDPLVGALERLLELPQSRIGVSEVLDLLDVPALRRRFAIDEGDLPLLHRWIRGANVRWGLHAEHRISLGLPAGDGDATAPDNTWLFGLRRLLLGYAAGQDATWHGIEAHGEAGGLDAALLGPLAQLLGRLDEAWHRLRETATPDQWCDRLRDLLTGFFDAGDEAGEAYVLQQLDEALQGWREACDEAVLAESLPLSVVAENWLAALDGGGLSQRFFAGAVTFATLMPMRAIPFRHVCLLGMNDGDYPRTRPPLDFDLMGGPGQYRPGDRSRREDDRYLFLEALLSARDRLYVSWVGRSVTDNAERPPSVLVAQLRDHLRAGWRLADGGDLLAALSVDHRLQAFSPRYFAGEDETFFTYAREWRAGAPAPIAHDVELPPLLRDEPLDLDALTRFLRDPVKRFFGDRLGVDFGRDAVVAEDVEAFEADSLEKWQRGDELVTAQLRAVACGADVAAARADALARIARRGEFAPGGFGTFEARELALPMEVLFDDYRKVLDEWPGLIEDEAIAVGLEVDGRVLALADRVSGLRANGAGGRARILAVSNALVETGKSKSGYRHHVIWRYWPAHLAAQLHGPTTTRLLSAHGDVTLAALDPDLARAHLEDLLRAWDEGMRRPLALAIRTGFAWLMNPDKARDAYEGGFNSPGERGFDAHLARAWPDFGALVMGGFEEHATRLLGPMHVVLYGEREDAR